MDLLSLATFFQPTCWPFWIKNSASRVKAETASSPPAVKAHGM